MNCHIIFSHYGRTNIFYPKDTIIFGEGGVISGIHYLQSGSVEIYKTDEDGKQTVIKDISEGDIFGHRCFFNKRFYHLTAIATEDSLVASYHASMINKTDKVAAMITSIL